MVSAAHDFIVLLGIETSPPSDLRTLAAAIDALVRHGYLVAMDEFQHFHRKALYELTSHLQYVVDQLARDAADVQGGLIVLGSIRTAMVALLDDRIVRLGTCKRSADGLAPYYARLDQHIARFLEL